MGNKKILELRIFCCQNSLTFGKTQLRQCLEVWCDKIILECNVDVIYSECSSESTDVEA